MANFNVGDSVKVIYHPDDRYIGLTGKVSSVNPDALAPNTEPVTDGGELPGLGRRTVYDIDVNGVLTLHRVHEDWIESA